MPSTPQQLEANRRNARHSTGPRTAAGKRRGRLNALKHGMRASDIVLTGHGDESAEEFDDLLARLFDELMPVGFLEEMLVGQIAVHHWRLRRVFRSEAAAITDARAGAERSAPPPLDLKRVFNDIGLAQTAGYYADPLVRSSQKPLVNDPDGLEQVLDCLQDAQHELDSTGSLEPPLRRGLTLCLDPLDEILVLVKAIAKNPATDHLTALRVAIRSRIPDLSKQLEELRQRRSAELDNRLGLHTLPSPEAAEKILRYEKAIQNQLYRAMTTLTRAQDARLSIPIPVAD